jgi:hypothetical protein
VKAVAVLALIAGPVAADPISAFGRCLADDPALDVPPEARPDCAAGECPHGADEALAEISDIIRWGIAAGTCADGPEPDGRTAALTARMVDGSVRMAEALDPVRLEAAYGRAGPAMRAAIDERLFWLSAPMPVDCAAMARDAEALGLSPAVLCEFQRVVWAHDTLRSLDRLVRTVEEAPR